MKTFKEYSQEVDEPVAFDENFMGYGSDAGGTMWSRHSKRTRDSDSLARNYLVGKGKYPDRKSGQHHSTYNAQWEKHKEELQAKKDADKGAIGKVISKAKVAVHKKIYGIHPTVKEEVEIDEASVFSYPLLNSVTGKDQAAKERAEFKRGVSRLVSKAKYNAKKKAAKTVKEESELDEGKGWSGTAIDTEGDKHVVYHRTAGSKRKLVSKHDTAEEAVHAAWKHAIKHDTEAPNDDSPNGDHEDLIDKHWDKYVKEETSLDEGMYLVGTYSNPKKEHIRVWQHSPEGYHYSIENTTNKKTLTHRGSLDAAVKKHSLVLNKEDVELEEYEPAPNVPRHIRAHANRSGGTHYNILGKLQKKQFTKDKQDHDDEGAIENAAARRKGW